MITLPPSTQSGHTIQDEGSSLPAQPLLDFQGAGVTAADGSGKTVVTIPGGGSASDASTTVKGIIKTSVAPVSAGSPIAVGDNDKRVQPQVSGTTGNFGATQTVDFASVPQQIWLGGTFNANLAVTVNNPVAGSRLRVLGLQDATGSRTLTVAGQAIPIPSTPSTGLASVLVIWLDAATFRYESAGVETDPSALLKANNLSDLANAGTARTNLGLGTAATLASDTDGTLVANSDARAATQKAVKTYVDAHAGGGGATTALAGGEVNNCHGWSFYIGLAASGGAGASGVVQLIKIPVPVTRTFSRAWVFKNDGAAGSANAFIGIYAKVSTNLVLLGKRNFTTDLNASGGGTTGGESTLTAEAGQSLAVTGGDGVFVWVGFLAGTLATVFGKSSGSDSWINFGLAQSDGYAYAKYTTTGQTALPSTIALTATATDLPFWAAVG